MQKTRKTVLTIAGSDSSGGAGIQADLKTMLANGVYGMTVITAITAQNTIEISKIQQTNAQMTKIQIDSVCSDILPDAIKIGMLYSIENIQTVAKCLSQYSIKEIVLDPVFLSSTGHRLLEPGAEKILKEVLFPLARLITPNLAEAAAFSGIEVRTKEDMKQAAKRLSEESKTSVLIKGGHLIGAAEDLLYTNGNFFWYCAERINNPNTHGTGCTLSTAIACNLAKGKTLQKSVAQAKNYLHGAICSGLSLGRGAGPLDHGWNLPE